jgi:HD-GYP domain-containing protein (c-di-GMP phosphodiesterase class II)
MRYCMELQTFDMMMVQLFTASLAAYDAEVEEHGRRLVPLAQATARELGQCEEEVELIGLAALLHDLGKLGIPQAILHKAGPLTNEEWVIIRRHPDIGRQLLMQAGGTCAPLAPLVGAHHERWDGKGYPDGLEREAIPLAARILSVIDSFDAMTSCRPYQKALTERGQSRTPTLCGYAV